MIVLLSHCKVDLTVEFAISEVLVDCLGRQLDRGRLNGFSDPFMGRIDDYLNAALSNAVDWDLRPPTPAQLTYARALARQLDVEVPEGAVKHRGIMCEFLDRCTQAIRKAR